GEGAELQNETRGGKLLRQETQRSTGHVGKTHRDMRQGQDVTHYRQKHVLKYPKRVFEQLKFLEISRMQGCSEDCRRVPPPKPKRNPNTQLSTSFDESYVRNATSRVSPPMPYSRDIKASSPPPLQPQSPQQDSDSEEPVYIEMSGSVCREPASRVEDEEPGEAVYEEMKYPLLDEYDSRWDLSSCRSQCATPCPSDIDSHNPLSRCSTPRGTLCDIPAPFPNLLTHRPPLLVFPPAPAQCSPNSDESPLTPLDVAKLPMLDNSSSYAKSPTSSSSLEPLSSASTSHIRRAERELTATPTLTVSGRSSAPPLPCALYRSSGNSHNYQRSHSACPSPVSMGRCLTPLSLMRTPAFDGPFSGPAMPRSASATPHGKGSPPQDQSSRLHGSMQNVSTGRSRTPTSPLDELTNLFTTGRNMLKKNSSGRKSKEPGESEYQYININKKLAIDKRLNVLSMTQTILAFYWTATTCIKKQTDGSGTPGLLPPKAGLI
uniref:Neuronal tyrosine-phosphorylated phosphoinositide-3-kinase adaptor 2b n=1 Tax=Astyanax mexicanus TaxID=7994 RepID=A0A8B9HUW4_ASTMX